MPSYVKFRKIKGSNRHSLDIVRDMLVVASVRVRKTRIMYQANLSYVQVKKYLQNLLEKDLLEHDGVSCYLITKKGLEFLRLYDEYVERCRQLEQQAHKSLKERLLLERMCFSREIDCNTKVTRNHALP